MVTAPPKPKHVRCYRCGQPVPQVPLTTFYHYPTSRDMLRAEEREQRLVRMAHRC